MNLVKQCKVSRVSSAEAAAQTEIDTSVVDMQGFDGCMFVVCLGDVTNACALEFTAQQSPYANAAGAADLDDATITNTAAGASNTVALVDVVRPSERYLRLKILRGSQDANVDSVVAIQYDPKVMPTTHNANVLASALGVNPDEE